MVHLVAVYYILEVSIVTGQDQIANTCLYALAFEVARSFLIAMATVGHMEGGVEQLADRMTAHFLAIQPTDQNGLLLPFPINGLCPGRAAFGQCEDGVAFWQWFAGASSYQHLPGIDQRQPARMKSTGVDIEHIT
ncbi:hypothetical protein [Vreelandella titanicae]|uniref:hypothetical protein n=1 Tax=Vreelandella titanicae TaxID=664683 RepID=UPI003FD7C932